MAGNLRDVSDLLWPAVQESLASVDTRPEDAAARKLAQRYAQVIDSMPDQAARGQPDQAWAMRWIGPLLLDALRELRATPAARAQAATGKGTAATPGSDQLAKIRQAKAGRRPAG
jgi:hypothetical protein